MKIGIIDYGVGNLGSIINALENINVQGIISNSPQILSITDAIILPGDGAAGEGMKNLEKRQLDSFIKKEIKKGKPFFGICLGMQLLLDRSEEGDVNCLGIFKGLVRRLKTTKKLPQIGWNSVQIKKEKLKMKKYNEKKILAEVDDNSYAYFIHSYICMPEDESIITGETTYGEKFCSVFEKENVFGAQFHPEKSGVAGRQILQNFINFALNFDTARKGDVC